MKARQNKIVSLLEFIQTGKLAEVELGWSKEMVLNSLSKPDCKSYMGHGLSIWQWSTFEMHFADDELYLLWCDGLRWLKNPLKKQFKFDKWIFRDTRRLNFSYFCSVLNELSISYSLKGTFYDPHAVLPSNVLLLVDGTNVRVYFEDYDTISESIEQYQLVAIGATQSTSSPSERDL